MAEWLKAHAWKACVRETVPWVRIPLSPPVNVEIIIVFRIPGEAPIAQPINSQWIDDQVPQMKKLLKLKQWLTVAEAARHLSTLFSEDVSEADVLRFALDGHLTLSVYFVNHAIGRCGRGPAVPILDAKWRFIQMSDGGWVHSIDGLAIEQNGVIEYAEQITVLDGIWDLTMLGSERLDVEHQYQILTGGPAVDLHFLGNPIVSRDDGTYCQVQERHSNNEFVNPEMLKPYDYAHINNYHPAARLPTDSVLVVRTSALRELEARMSEPKPIETRERTTLLVIIAALAELQKIDLKKPSSAAVAIEAQTASMGARVSARTIEDHLKRIPDALEGRSG
jgi:hypothetical protein